MLVYICYVDQYLVLSFIILNIEHANFHNSQFVVTFIYKFNIQKLLPTPENLSNYIYSDLRI